MRYSCLILGSLATLFILVGCSSVYETTPESLKKAQTELDRANQMEVENYFPTTMGMANSTFDEARALRSNIQNEKSIEKRATQTAAMIVKAETSRDLAIRAQEATIKVRRWDNMSPEEKRSVAIFIEDAVQRERERMTTPPSETVAFFDTGQASLSPLAKRYVGSIAKVLQDRENVQFELTGFSDPTGGSSRNIEIAQKRANSVAKVLVDNGISRNRIGFRTQTVEGNWGEKIKSPLLRQATRRVDLRIVTLTD